MALQQRIAERFMVMKKKLPWEEEGKSSTVQRLWNLCKNFAAKEGT